MSGDSPRLGNVVPPSPTIWPVYNGDNSASAPTGNFLIAGVMNAEFTMASGTFAMGGGAVYLGYGNTTTGGFTGTWTHNGGTFAGAGRAFDIGRYSGATGRLIMNGGQINAASMSVGRIAGAAGHVEMYGGTITVTGGFNLSSEVGATSTLTMVGGQINCGSSEWAYNGYSTISIRDAVFYANNFVSLNNAKNAKAYATIGSGAVVDADKLVFAKCDVVIEAGGLMQARGLNTGTDAPVTVLSNGRIDLQGGLLKLHHYDPPSFYSYIDQWITEGRIYTTLPGHWVTYDYDYDTEFISIYAVPEPAGLVLILTGAALLRRRR